MSDTATILLAVGSLLLAVLSFAGSVHNVRQARRIRARALAIYERAQELDRRRTGQ